MIGQNLKGRYGIHAEFYADKLGTAYKATDTQDGTPVVVLVLDEQVSTGGDEVSALLAAAGAVRELDSPILVPTTASGITDDGKVFLVHPLPDAVPLKSLVKGGMPIEQVVDITRQIALGASVASEAGLQHLDLSGNSVQVTVLSDGGQVARVTRHGYQSLLPLYSTAKKNLPFYGTAEYMAPELCSGKGADPRSDIYSLGILMYEMVVGKCPFVSNNVQTVLKRQIFEKPLPLHLLKRGVAGINDFEKIVFQALQKMPARRQESMAQLVEQLDAFRAEFLAEADLTPLPAADWPEIGGVEESAAPVPEAAAEEAERRPAETMMFSGISPEQVAAAAMTEPDASAAAAEAAEPDVETLKMPYAAAEKVVEEALAEQTADQIEDEDPAKKTLMMAPIPAAAESAAAVEPVVDTAAARTPTPSAPTPPAGAGPDDDWFVDSGQDLAAKEQPPQSWGEQKTGSNVKFYVLIGIIALLIVVLIVVILQQNKTTDAPKEETEKAQLDPAMKRQLEQEKKAEAARKAQEEKARKIRDELAADKAAKAQAASEAAAKKAADDAVAAEEKARLDAKRAELTDRFLAVRTKGQGLRNQLSERRGKWAGESAEAKMAEIDQAIVSLDRIIAPEKMKKLANDMAGDTLGTVEGRVQRLEGQVAAFKVRSDRLLAEAAAPAESAEEAAAKLAEEEAAKKAAEEAAAAKAAEEAAAGALTEEEAAKKAAEEAAAAKLAEEEAVKLAEEEAAKLAEEEAAKLAEEAAAAKAAEEAAAKKAAEEAAAKKAAEAAAAKKAAEAAAKKAGGDDAAAKKAAEAAAKKKAAEAAAAKKAAEAAAAKKAAEAAAAKKAAEEAAAKKAAEEAGDADQGKALMKDGISAYKKGKWDAAISTFEKAKAAGGNAGLADKYIAKAQAKKAEAAKKAADEAAAKKAADEAAAKKAADEAAAKKAADAAAAEKAADAAAAKKAADAAAAKKAADAAAAKKAADAAAAKKAADAAAAKKADSGQDAEKAKKYMKLGISAYKKGSHALAIKYFEKAKNYAADGGLADKWIDKAKKAQAGD